MNKKAYTYLYNGHADVTALADENGQITASYYYDAFGVLLEESGKKENPFRYAGEYYDSETGYICLQSRYYVPNTGRFMSEDSHWNASNMIYGDTPDKITADEEKEDFIPNTTAMMQSCNKYVYCINNPIRYTDPTGEYVYGIALEFSVGAGLGIYASVGFYFDNYGDYMFAYSIGGSMVYGAQISLTLNGSVSTADSVGDMIGYSFEIEIGGGIGQYMSFSGSVDSLSGDFSATAGIGWGSSIGISYSQKYGYTDRL